MREQLQPTLSLSEITLIESLRVISKRLLLGDRGSPVPCVQVVFFFSSEPGREGVECLLCPVYSSHV